MKVAIVDIGSNAVRASIYLNQTLGSPVIFHHKFKCDIRSLINQKIMVDDHDVFRCFRYFIKVFDNYEVEKIKCVATAVLRNHEKSQEFLFIIKQNFGLDIEILSGEEEASLTAKGLINSIENVNGLAADMGGGSLEVMAIEDGNIKKTLSLPLDSKVENNDKIDEILDIISRHFKEQSFENLYLIGGAFRAIGCDFIYRNQNYIKVLHNLSIPVFSFYAYTKIIDNNTLNTTQHNAIKIISSMIKSSGAQNIIISSHGLKEGVRFHYYMNPQELEKDMVFERLSCVTSFNKRNCDLEKLYSVISKVSGLNDKLFKDAVLYAIMLTNFYHQLGCIAGGNFATDFVMCSNIPFTVQQRIMIVNVVATVYYSIIPCYITNLSKTHINYTDYIKSKIIGHYIRILLEIDGKQIIKPTFDLSINSNNFLDIITDYPLPRATYLRIQLSLRKVSTYIWKLQHTTTSD